MHSWSDFMYDWVLEHFIIIIIMFFLPLDVDSPGLKWKKIAGMTRGLAPHSRQSYGATEWHWNFAVWPTTVDRETDLPVHRRWLSWFCDPK